MRKYNIIENSDNKNIETLGNDTKVIGNIIRSEKLSFSIGEIIELYENNEIFFGDKYEKYEKYSIWSCRKKSELIQAIILEFELPSLFLLQNLKGSCCIINGKNILHTIFDFIGCLKENDKLISDCYEKFDRLSDNLFCLSEFNKSSFNEFPEKIRIKIKSKIIKLFVFRDLKNVF